MLHSITSDVLYVWLETVQSAQVSSYSLLVQFKQSSADLGLLLRYKSCQIFLRQVYILIFEILRVMLYKSVHLGFILCSEFLILLVLIVVVDVPNSLLLIGPDRGEFKRLHPVWEHGWWYRFLLRWGIWRSRFVFLAKQILLRYFTGYRIAHLHRLFLLVKPNGLEFWFLLWSRFW